MRGVLAACLIVATGCQDNDPLYCGKHPADLDNCPRAGCYGMAALGLLACATVTPPGPIAIGAAGDSADCMPAIAATGGGGGAGGSFAGAGGSGGDQALAPGSKAIAGVTITWSSLRGGCKGTAGAGMGGVDNSGHGGGAVALLAASIAIEGTLDASGSAGGAGHFSGGGGGGAGGMIALQAKT